ncbi:hypothetical protein K1719_039418 [Acacia pycnantha]|nr:hypothetical protein K1719_039418 [Acacia pycnantha]
MSVPRLVVLIKSNYNNKYLRYIQKDLQDVQVHKFLQFSEEKIVSPYKKFEVEMAKSKNGLMHIRSCYNNKYWVRWTQNHWWIVAGADKPEEDQSKWSCTLFKPILVDSDAKTIRFLHVQLGHYACLWRANAPFASCLYAGSKNPDQDSCDVYTIIEWKSPLIMPKHVHGFLQFSGEEVVSQYAKFEVKKAKSDNGLVHIRCCYNNKYWVRWTQNHWWIVARADEPEEDQSKWSCTLFKPVYVDADAKTIRFLHVQLGKYACLWRIAAPFASCLFAGSGNPDKDSCDVCTIIDGESLSIVIPHINLNLNNNNNNNNNIVINFPGAFP